MNKRDSLLLLISVLFVLLILPQHLILGQEIVTIEGTIKEHRTGNPIPKANILALRRYYGGQGAAWQRWLGEADLNGHFVLELPERQSYFIYAYYNDSLTPGFDYVPSMKSIQWASGKYNLTFELWEGASMFLDGEVLLVETTEFFQSSYSVLDPDSGEVIKYGEYTFNYWESSSHYQIPGVSPNHIVVPANTSFSVKVDSQIEVEREWLTRSFFIDKPNQFVLGRGDPVHVDLREYSLPLSLSIVKAEASEIGRILDETDVEGFYLAVERQRLAQITSLILEAESKLNQGAYEPSFTKLRGAYVAISNLRNWLDSMHREALISAFLLIPFLAFTATTISYLLFEEKLYKFGGASVFYAVLLIGLYLLYPGSRLVEVSLFLGVSLLSLILVLGLAAWVPRVLKGKEVRGRVPLRNMVVPIFSIAKRSLRRRRLRFVLTLISVMILVSSFITLTSFAVGFGLTFKKVSSQPGPSMGVLVRAPKPLELEEGHLFWFSPLDNASIEWFEERSETLLVVPKYENLPSPEPLISVGEASIFGIIGVVPSLEAEVLSLNETIIEGRYLSDEDENGVLISKRLKESLNTAVGESLILRREGEPLRLEVIGVFDDKSFKRLRDLDGESILPRKIEIWVSPGYLGPPKKYLETCLTNETLVTTWRTAAEIDGIELSRLNVFLEAGEDLEDYAKKIVLLKGFRGWASTEEGVYLAQLSSYFEGKGLPIAVPWAIVVLNVVVTMLNSLYERRRDIYIYSAIGMNPSHISGAFLAEAAMIGVLGGGVGYLVGLGWYKAMSFLALGLQVKQKVSALWVLAALSVSLAAVLVGGLAALKGSVVITPSLKRRWKIEEGVYVPMEPLELTLPVRVAEEEVEVFVEYVMKRFRSHLGYLEFAASRIRESKEETEEASLRIIEFIYQPASVVSAIHSENRVILRKEKDSEVYTVKLLTQGGSEGVYRTGSFIRKILMEWSIERGKLEERK